MVVLNLTTEQATQLKALVEIGKSAFTLDVEGYELGDADLGGLLGISFDGLSLKTIENIESRLELARLEESIERRRILCEAQS